MTTRIPVEYRRREPDESLIRSGVLPSARTWQDLAALANWLAGNGACVVSGHAVDAAIMPNPGSFTLRYWTKPRANAIFRIWALHLRAFELDDSGATVSITAPAGVGTALVVPLPLDKATPPIYYLEVVTSPAATEQELNIKFETTGSGSFFIDCIRCYEMQRATLPGPTSGVDTTTERPGERIYAGTGVSVLGVAEILAACDPRRVAIFHWAVPDTIPIVYGGAYSGMFALGVPVLTRKLHKTSTKGVVWWSVYAKVSAIQGDINLSTSDSAVNDTLSISNTSFAWSTPRQINIDCDDTSTDDGLPGSSVWDEMTIQIRNLGKAATISIAGISIWEA